MPMSKSSRDGLILLTIFSTIALSTLIKTASPGAAFLPFVIGVPVLLYLLRVPIKKKLRDPSKPVTSWDRFKENWW